MSFEEWVLYIFAQYGVTEATFLIVLVGLLFLNSSIMVPSSEVVCVSAGILCAAAGYDLTVAIAFGALANSAGTLPWYWLGRFHSRRGMYLAHNKGAEDTIVSNIKRIYLEPLKDVENALRKHGVSVLFVLRNVPIIRSICSYPCGHITMSIGAFLATTVGGMATWIAIWILSGAYFGQLILDYSVPITLASILITVSVVSFLIRRSLRMCVRYFLSK